MHVSALTGAIIGSGEVATRHASHTRNVDRRRVSRACLNRSPWTITRRDALSQRPP